MLLHCPLVSLPPCPDEYEEVEEEEKEEEKRRRKKKKKIQRKKTPYGECRWFILAEGGRETIDLFVATTSKHPFVLVVV